MLHSMYQQILKTQQRPQNHKISVSSPTPEKGSAKDCSNYWTIALILQASKVMHKIIETRVQQYVNWELPNVQGGFQRGKLGTGTRNQIANIRWIIEEVRKIHKKSTSASMTMPKPLTV